MSLSEEVNLTSVDVAIEATSDVSPSHEHARLRQALEHMSDAYWAVDFDWRMIDVNPTAERIWGRTRAELLGRNIWEMFPLVVGTRNYRDISRAMAQRTFEEFRDYSPALDRWVTGYAYPTREGLAVHFQDRTDQRARDLAQIEHQARYRAVLESIDEGFCVIEMLFNAAGEPIDYRFLETNLAFEQHTGLHQPVGKRMRELAPDHEPFWFEAYGEVARTGQAARFTRQALALEGRWFDVYATRIGDPESRTVALFFRDISERRQAGLETSRLASIVENSADAILSCTLDGIIVNWNQGAETLFGYSSEEAIGKPMSFLSPADRQHEAAELVERLNGDALIEPLETIMVRKNGVELGVQIRLSPIKDASGETVGVSAIVRDVTERKRMEQLQKDFIAMASHDLASPLTVLRARAQLMQRRQEYDESSLLTMIEQTKRMERLIADLRDLVRLETGQFELQRTPCDMVDLVRAAVDRAATQHPDRTIAHVPHVDSATGDWDEDRVGQVLDNLLGNAAKHTPAESSISLSLSATDQAVTVSVTDSGPGIDPNAIPRLFDRFYRANRQIETSGLGFGLYISRMLIEAHGGRIWVESQPGGGSTFTFSVPRATTG
jgi:PAS domain S-box-containing protein